VKEATYFTRTRSFALMVLFLVALVAAMSSLLYVLLAKAPDADAKTRDYLVKLAYLDGAALLLTVFILVGTVVHHWATRLTDPLEPPRRGTPHVSAWDEAGKRLKNAPPIEPYEKPEEKP
jgi:hypothetical protein